MSRLITSGNLAVFEYPIGATDPEFTLEENGTLWVSGYSIPFIPTAPPIRAMKRFETNLTGYRLLGKYEQAKDKIQGDFSAMMVNVDIKNCILLAKN